MKTLFTVLLVCAALLQSVRGQQQSAVLPNGLPATLPTDGLDSMIDAAMMKNKIHILVFTAFTEPGDPFHYGIQQWGTRTFISRSNCFDYIRQVFSNSMVSIRGWSVPPVPGSISHVIVTLDTDRWSVIGFWKTLGPFYDVTSADLDSLFTHVSLARGVIPVTNSFGYSFYGASYSFEVNSGIITNYFDVPTRKWAYTNVAYPNGIYDDGNLLLQPWTCMPTNKGSIWLHSSRGTQKYTQNGFPVTVPHLAMQTNSVMVHFAKGTEVVIESGNMTDGWSPIHTAKWSLQTNRVVLPIECNKPQMFYRAYTQ